MPDWFKQSIIYHVFIDRFNGVNSLKNSTDFLGGNLIGVTDKLDYLQDLGINVIWLSPFYKSVSYHGYHIVNFREVDPHFGTIEDLNKLIKIANQKDIKVIADFVPNHCSCQHPYFIDACENKQSIYADWFIFKKWPNKYLSFLDFKELPKINLDNPEACNYMIKTAEYWLSMGLDGFRIDHVIGPSFKFWKEFKNKVVDKYPEAVFLGEAWASGLDSKLLETVHLKTKVHKRYSIKTQQKLQMDYNGYLTGVLDFYLHDLLVKSVHKGIKFTKDVQLKGLIKKHLKKLPADYTMVTFLDNHDMDRFLRHCKGDVNVLLEAYELLFSLNLPIVIYNGTENCTYNKTPVSINNPHSDLGVRSPIDWNKLNPYFVEGFKYLVKRQRQ